MKLHLGSGRRTLKGFLQVDIEPWPNVDIVSDIGDLTMIDIASVDEIYTSHSFEYFDARQAVSVLAEWKRVLRRGGKLFISVPDFASLVRIYEETGDLSKIIGPLFGRWESVKVEGAIYHRTVYDFDSLSEALRLAGFSQIELFDPVKYLADTDPDYDDYSLAYFPHMDRRGIQVSLCVSCTA
jgi:predicted SAM-dependent methyltransferase